MTRQYIGARYVPKFFSGVNGSNEWDNRVGYEPLTVVTYLGNSYTSKKPVPIGVDITDKDYWCLTGNYNAQIGMLTDRFNNKQDYKYNYVNIYVNSVSGYDGNDGLSVNKALKTFDKAVEKGSEYGNEFRIILGTGDYYTDLLTLSGVTLHIVGNNSNLTFNKVNVAIYNSHLNFSDLSIDSSSGWYTDNSYNIFTRCKFLSDFTQNGGSIETNTCEFSSIKLNNAISIFSTTTFKDITHSSRSVSLTSEASLIFILGTLRTNYNTSPSMWCNLVGSEFHVSSRLGHLGVIPPIVMRLNNSVYYGSAQRANDLKPYTLTNGGRLQTELYTITGENFSRTINELVLPCYYTNNNVIRLSLYNDELYPYTQGSVTINSLTVYINGENIQPTVTNAVVTDHQSCKLIDITISDGTKPDATSGVCRVSLTLNLSL